MTGQGQQSLSKPSKRDFRTSSVDVASHPHLASTLEAWLSDPAVRSPEGALYAWLDAATGHPSFEYPEITGYALTFVAGLREPSDEQVDSGRQAGEWLVRRLAGDDYAARAGWDGHAAYNFDLGMIATGLQSFGERFDVAEFIDTGVQVAADLRQQIERCGHLQNLRPPGDASARSAWSTEGFAHLVKVVQCLLWADSLGLAGCVDAAAAVVAAGVEHQRDDGRFVTHPRDEETMLHPHLYAIEGLWVYGTVTSDESALRRARRAAEWAWSCQLHSGAIPRYVSTATGEAGPGQADATAQAVRAAVVLGTRPQGLDAAVAWLHSIAVRVGPTQSALPYQAASDHLNVWASLFGTQALGAASADGSPLAWKHLV